jgi:hypothetical protein
VTTLPGQSFDTSTSGIVFSATPLLFGRQIIDSGAIARAPVVALAVDRGWVVNLKEEFEQRTVAHDLGIEHNLNRFSCGRAIGRLGLLRQNEWRAVFRYSGSLNRKPSRLLVIVGRPRPSMTASKADTRSS